MKRNYKIAVIGATGLVGRTLIDLLEKENLPIDLRLFASEKSKGKTISFKKNLLPVEVLSKNLIKNFDLVFLMAGKEISKELCANILHENQYVIDSSSSFRLKENVPLVIPEINERIIQRHRFIASPNCTTTLLLMALYPLHKKYALQNLIVSSYQAASGGGKKLMDQLFNETKDFFTDGQAKNYGFNLFLHESSLNENLYSEEEMKIADETKKILEDQTLQISATCVRVPVLRAHSLSVHALFEKDIDLNDCRNRLKTFPGISLRENATPSNAAGKNNVYVSRIRKVPYSKKALEIWVVGDQLLKGASLNALQIGKKLLKDFF